MTKKLAQTRAPLPTAKPKTPLATNKTDNTGPRPKTWPYKMSEVFNYCTLIDEYSRNSLFYNDSLHFLFVFIKFWFLTESYNIKQAMIKNDHLFNVYLCYCFVCKHLSDSFWPSCQLHGLLILYFLSAFL